MGDISIKGRSKLLGGGRVGFKSGGRVGFKSGGRVGFKSGGRTGFKSGSNYVPDVAKSAQHPHSGLKTQKEYKAITDSDEYKKGDYKKKVEMLEGKTWTAQEMQTKIKNKKAGGGRIGLKKGKGTGGQEPWWKNREKTKIYKAEGGSVRIARKGGGRAYGKNS